MVTTPRATASSASDKRVSGGGGHRGALGHQASANRMPPGTATTSPTSPEPGS